jgi:peptidoglycan/xylan/chitin deacetylase (PgdA/CDA1 family)
MAARELALSSARRSLLRLAGVPVLLYHGLGESPPSGVSARERKYHVPASRFRAHLEQFHQENRRVSLLRDFWDGTEATASQAASLVVTFDDGMASDYTIAFPALVAAGYRAEFFLNTAEIGKPGFLSWPEIKEMHRAGMSFQSHAHDHVDLTRLSEAALARQLETSKRLLEENLGTTIEFLAVPYGQINARVIHAAERAEFRSVCTSVQWPARPGMRTISRAAVYAHTTPAQLRKLLAGDLFIYSARRIRSAMLSVPKQILLCTRPNRLGVRVLEEQP